MISDVKEIRHNMEDYLKKFTVENEHLKENYKLLETQIEIKDKELAFSAASDVQIQDISGKMVCMEQEILKLENEIQNLNDQIEDKDK